MFLSTLTGGLLELRSLYEQLQARILEMIETLDELRAGAEMEICREVEQEIAGLQAEAERVAEEVAESFIPPQASARVPAIMTQLLASPGGNTIPSRSGFLSGTPCNHRANPRIGFRNELPISTLPA